MAVKTHSGSYLSVPTATADDISARKAEIRGDAEAVGEQEGIRVKCQREFVLKERIAALESKEGASGKRRLLDRRGPTVGSVEDELNRKCVPPWRVGQDADGQFRGAVLGWWQAPCVQG